MSPSDISPTGVGRIAGAASTTVIVASPIVMRSPGAIAPPENSRPFNCTAPMPRKRSR